MSKTIEIKGKGEDGQEVTIFLKHPTSADYAAAKLYSNKVAATITQQKTDDGKPAFLTRAKVRDLLTETGQWNAELEEELITTARTILELERKLAKGGIKLSEGKEAALLLRKLRDRQVQILTKTREMDTYTLEAQVENANFDHILFSCLLDDEGNKLFSSVDDYRERGTQPYVFTAASKLAELMYGLETNNDTNLPENKFLVKYKFVDENLRLINKEGHLVDERGRKIDIKGRLVNDNDELIDTNGNRVTEDGEPLEEFQEFIED